jgi:hypothetical protein
MSLPYPYPGDGRAQSLARLVTRRRPRAELPFEPRYDFDCFRLSNAS